MKFLNNIQIRVKNKVTFYLLVSDIESLEHSEDGSPATASGQRPEEHHRQTCSVCGQ